MDSSWNLEMTTRLSLEIIGFGATPPSVGLAWVRWTRDIRQELPPWRNGVGLASFVIISALRLLQVTRLILWVLLSRDPTRYWSFELPALYLWAPLPLACALKGASRLLLIASWALVQLFYAAATYS